MSDGGNRLILLRCECKAMFGSTKNYLRRNKKLNLMVALPLSVLALAAGVYLLVKVKREFLGGLFEALSWLVILLSLVSIGFLGYKTMRHCGGSCERNQKCHIEREVIIKEGMGGGGTCHGGAKMSCGGAEMAAGCRAVGDSMVMDMADCEKMMGKEKCQAMHNERGQCIMSKEECKAACDAAGKKCCATEAKATCTKEKKCCATKEAK